MSYALKNNNSNSKHFLKTSYVPVGVLRSASASFISVLSHLILSKPCERDTIIIYEPMRKPNQGTERLRDLPKITQLPSGGVSIQIQKGKSMTDCKTFRVLFNSSELQFVCPYKVGGN